MLNVACMLFAQEWHTYVFEQLLRLLCVFPGALPEEVTARLPPEDTLHVLVACGPYNISEQIQPDPLKDFMLYVKDNKPDLVILMGPFVDERFVENETFLNDSNFIDHFKSVVSAEGG